MKLLSKLKKRHVHTPTDPWAVALMRNHARPGDSLKWRCICGEMVEDDDEK